jgi:hypothetical protein
MARVVTLPRGLRPPPPDGYRWDFTTLHGERVTFNAEPVVDLVRINWWPNLHSSHRVDGQRSNELWRRSVEIMKPIGIRRDTTIWR